MEAARVQVVLDRIRLHRNFPYPTEFVAHETAEGILVEGRPTFTNNETGQVTQRGIIPEFCSVLIPAGSSETVIAKAAHDALAKFASHEVSESLTIDGAFVVVPHPERS